MEGRTEHVGHSTATAKTTADCVRFDNMVTAMLGRHSLGEGWSQAHFFNYNSLKRARDSAFHHDIIATSWIDVDEPIGKLTGGKPDEDEAY